MRLDRFFTTHGILYNLRVNSVKPVRYIYNKIFRIDSGLTKKITYRILDPLINEKKDKPFIFLDAGCGSGTFMKELQDRYNNRIKLFGVDLSKELIKFASEKQTGDHFCVCSIDALPFKRNSFDGACVNFVFHHLPVDIQNEVLNEIRRVTQGTLLIRDVTREHNLIGNIFRIYWALYDGGTKYRTKEEWHEFLKNEKDLRDYRGAYPDYLIEVSV